MCLVTKKYLLQKLDEDKPNLYRPSKPTCYEYFGMGSEYIFGGISVNEVNEEGNARLQV